MFNSSSSKPMKFGPAGDGPRGRREDVWPRGSSYYWRRRDVQWSHRGDPGRIAGPLLSMPLLMLPEILGRARPRDPGDVYHVARER
ncbi:hypothetical protein CCHR01_01196 [Colletotrichum chrysophilum]|uniref:Uncharacterized protein n=1 Tax=Colletotrichum chrysophilum TaxID=1836956 RepID=A0AAD9AX62_9PEZI|nr:hypothetical protein CCHR01_01196 [Colletotrichum chrysophilum]